MKHQYSNIVFFVRNSIPKRLLRSARAPMICWPNQDNEFHELKGACCIYMMRAFCSFTFCCVFLHRRAHSSRLISIGRPLGQTDTTLYKVYQCCDIFLLPAFHPLSRRNDRYVCRTCHVLLNKLILSFTSHTVLYTFVDPLNTFNQ